MTDEKLQTRDQKLHKVWNTVLRVAVPILLALIVGSIIFIITGISPLEAYKVIFDGAFGRPKYIGWTIVQAVPLILTGLSTAFAFRTGLFNIGAEGQFIVGSIAAVSAGILLELPPVIHPIVCLIVGAIAGGLWGGLVGILKSKFKVNEVISSIMLNWIALYLNNFILTFNSIRKPESDDSYNILETASIRILGNWKQTDAGIEFLNNHEVIGGLLDPPMNYGIIVAIVVAIWMWYTLKNTTLGYRLRAVGYNSHAAEYGGINVEKNVALAMFIAGAIAGLGGAIQVLGVRHRIGILSAMQGYGFDGIGVALVAGNHAIGTIPAGILFSALNYGGSKLNSALGAPSEIVNIVIGTIVFFIAIPTLVDLVRFKRKGKGKGQGPDSMPKEQTVEEELEDETPTGGEEHA